MRRIDASGGLCALLVLLLPAPAAGFDPIPWTADPTDSPASGFGYSVAVSGDVNGDGYDDLAVGAPYWTGTYFEGRTYLFLGSPAGLEPDPVWFTDPADAFNATFGSTVAFEDVDGDGNSDLLVSAQSWSFDAGAEGVVLAYMGSAAGLGDTADWVVHPTAQMTAYFGSAVAGAGDVNGDGYGDVIVGAKGFDGEADREGRAYVYLGSPIGLEPDPAWTADPTDELAANFGLSAAGAGDVNGDGYDDVIVGSPNRDVGTVSKGRAYVYLGSPIGLELNAAWTADPTDQEFSSFGWAVAGAGDVNGDGYDDVIVSAKSWDGEAKDEGRAFLYLGSASGLELAPAWTADPTNQNARFGVSLAGAGDVNGDGYDDVIVGAEWYDADVLGEGRAYVYLGNASGLEADPAWTTDPTDQMGAPRFAHSVAGGGDVNADGMADVAIGAWEWEGDAPLEGRVYVYYGSSLCAGGPCSDGDVCNGEETCEGGLCQAGTPLVCDDGDPCTIDSCDSTAGCQSSNTCGTDSGAAGTDAFIGISGGGGCSCCVTDSDSAGVRPSYFALLAGLTLLLLRRRRAVPK